MFFSVHRAPGCPSSAEERMQRGNGETARKLNVEFNNAQGSFAVVILMERFKVYETVDSVLIIPPAIIFISSFLA